MQILVIYLLLCMIHFQEFRNFSSGISGRINQWVQNKKFTLSHSPSVSSAICMKLSIIKSGEEHHNVEDI